MARPSPEAWAPPSIRKAKRPADDPISQRAKYLFDAAKAYEISAPILAAHLGRQTLKIVSSAPKSLSRECLRLLCPKCGYPWEASNKERFILKPLTSWKQARLGTASRTGSAKPNALRCSTCRLCGWTETAKVYADQLQVGKGVGAGQAGQNSSRALSGVGKDAERHAAEEGGTSAEGVPHVENVPTSGTMAQRHHSLVAGATGVSGVEGQHASARAVAIAGDEPLTETLPPSICGARENPNLTDVQPDSSTAQGSGMRQQCTPEANNIFEEHDEASPTPAEPLPLFRPEACAGVATDLVEAAHDVGHGHDTTAMDNVGEGAATAGRQGDIRSQVRHMMDAKLPIVLAMREAVKQFEGNEAGPDPVPKWPHRSMKGKHRHSAHRYRWLRVGRSWKKRVP